MWLARLLKAGMAVLMIAMDGEALRAQEAPLPDSPLVNPRSELPFGTLPTQLPGPPRAEGEPGPGASMAPSTLPGRMPGPPRAEGYSPFAPFLIPQTPRLVVPGEGLAPLPGSSLLPPSIGPSYPDLMGPFNYLTPEFGTPGMGLQGPPRLPYSGAERLEPGAMPLFGINRPDVNASIAPLLPRPPRSLTEAENARKPVKARPLQLEDVLGSAERTYPPFLAYIQERAIAAGNYLTSEGSFDLNLNVDSRNWGLGYYRRNLFDIFFEQPTTLWGTKFFWGWRLGVGDWPIYYQYLQTNQGGAYVGGMDVPLLKGGRIDAKRAKLWQSVIERQKVEPAISKQRIDLYKNAAKVYWNWVAAGQSYLVYDSLLRLAQIRTKFLERQVELGILSPIELTDNQRVVLSRENLVITARQRFQEASLELSLILRDSGGMPVIPDPDRLPLRFPDLQGIDAKRFPEDLEVALRLRPELRVLQLEYRKTGIDLDLAENTMLPAMNLYVYGEQNVGAQVPLQNKSPFILETSILFDVPLQRRVAKGRIQAVNAELRQTRLRIQFTQDRIVANVKEAMANLQAALEQMTRYRDYVEINLRLQKAEVRRFNLGSSTIFFVTLREQATADAQVSAIESVAKYLSAQAEYRAALGVDALPPGDSPTP